MMREDFMRRAITLSREHMRAGDGGPFGAVIVKDGVIVGEGWNRVVADNDPTAHAEIAAIRDACQRLRTFNLAGAEIYASCEPCPMCLAAICWARLERVYFANTCSQAADIGFDDAVIYRELAAAVEARTLAMIRLLGNEAKSVFDEWAAKPDKVRY
jgi:guanine deaminase